MTHTVTRVRPRLNCPCLAGRARKDNTSILCNYVILELPIYICILSCHWIYFEKRKICILFQSKYFSKFSEKRLWCQISNEQIGKNVFYWFIITVILLYTVVGLIQDQIQLKIDHYCMSCFSLIY